MIGYINATLMDNIGGAYYNGQVLYGSEDMKIITVPQPLGSFDPTSFFRPSSYEIGMNTPYNFYLKPTFDLPADAVFEIDISGTPLTHYNPSSCTCGNAGSSCIISGNIVIITNALAAPYILTDGNFIQFNIQYFTSPLTTVEYSSYQIYVRSLVLSQIRHEGHISCDLAGRYNPHALNSLAIMPNNYNTAAILHYNLKWTCAYDIASGDSIQITFPSDITFSTLTPPDLIRITGLNSAASGVVNYPMFTISNGFPSGLSANNLVEFNLSNIINPYKIGMTPLIDITILPNIANPELRSFTGSTQINIDSISPFAYFEVQPGSYITSERSDYIFTFQVGGGKLKAGHKLLYTTYAVKGCTPGSITGMDGFTNPITGTVGSTGFIIPNDIDSTTMAKFKVSCINPETTRPLTSFSLQAIYTDGTDYVFYTSQISTPITMSSLNTFVTVNVNYGSSYVLTSNSINFTVEKSMPYTSSDINNIEIIGIGYYSMACGMSYSGFTLSGYGCTISGTSLLLSGIANLTPNFYFILTFINPMLSTDTLSVQLITRNSDGYMSEISSVITQNIPCDFPCRTCTTSPTYCSSCFTSGNITFARASSGNLFILHSGTCVESCPSHTYEDAAVCVPCHPICDECDVLATNCTKCDGNYLLNNQCLPSCDPGYSEDAVNWVCVEIADFLSDSYIKVIGDTEIEKNSSYRFYLRPETLMTMSTTLEITLPSYIRNYPPTTSTPGTLHNFNPATSNLTNFLTIDYVPSASFIEFTLEPIRNPFYTYSFADIKVTVTSFLGSVIYHQGEIALSNPDSGISRYLSHSSWTVSMTNPSSVTVTETQLSFEVETISYLIRSGDVITVILPSDFDFIAIPTLSIPAGSNLQPSATLTIDGNMVSIENGFSSTVFPGQTVQFEIQNILNPYKLGITSSLAINIRSSSHIDHKSFNLETGLTSQILSSSPFISYFVTSDNPITSAISNYRFQAQLGLGKLKTIHHIVIMMPISITECDHNTITDIVGFTSPITSTSNGGSIGSYFFHLPCEINAGTTFTFKISCRNPETTRPIEQILLGANLNSDSTPTGQFYSQNFSGLSMALINTFAEQIKIELDSYHQWSTNTFTFFINRTSPHDSIDINQIKIKFPSYLRLYGSNCHASDYVNMTVPGSLSCNRISSTTIKIRGFTSVKQEFMVKIYGIRNPSRSTENIYFNLTTMNEDEYISESSQSEEQNLPCNFPCMECDEGFPDNCTHCFPDGDAAFDGGTSYYLFYSDQEVCVDVCPTHVFNDSLTTCAACDATCSECDISSTNCTQCYPDTYLFDNFCDITCPPKYVKDDPTWTCLRTLSLYF